MNSQPKRSNKTLFILLLAFVLPVAAAKLVLSLDLYHGGATNKGALLDINLTYQALEIENPKPHLWQMVYLLPAKCAQQCQDSLYVLNQSYIALGRDRDRVSPVILLQPDSDTQALEQLQIQFETVKANSKIATVFSNQPVIIVDPLGSLVMQYDSVVGRDASISQGKAMIADLRKMLKLSRVG